MSDKALQKVCPRCGAKVGVYCTPSVNAVHIERMRGPQRRIEAADIERMERESAFFRMLRGKP